ncbi:ferredoxin-like protein ydiT [Escherichia coli UMEA 3193-1]|nr:ferredoxin-like protein ydiT [Escherichia coli UMEA 3193-1]
MSQNATVNIDIKLGVNKFHVDEGHPHIILAANPDINEFRKLMKACPAGLYKQETFISIPPVVWSAAPVGCCAATLFSNSGNIPQAPSVLNFATANHASHRPASWA